MAQLVKNLPAVQETWVRSLGWEDPLEKGTAPHSSILSWRVPWGCKESDTTERLSLSLTLLRPYSGSARDLSQHTFPSFLPSFFFFLRTEMVLLKLAATGGCFWLRDPTRQ